ncbi:hypothetical protein FNSP4_13140 [Fusobacterium nucleatum]|nr:hypothetical protein FNCP4_07180 [Fusobacterium nucleatum]BEP03580.1 hypothetical protein FNSP4_13140 [Fusobacterium nucleatum]
MDKRKLNDFLTEIGVEKESLEFNKDKINKFVDEINTKVNINSYYIAKMLVEENNLIKIDNLIYGYNERCYQCLTNTDIENLIHQVNKNLNEKQRKEILKKIYFEAPNKEKDINHISVKNGLINITDDEIVLYEHTSKIVTTFYIDYDYNPNADYTDILNYMSELVGDDESLTRILMEFLGYCLYPDCFLRKALVIKGDHRNGKSKFLEVLKIFFGDNNCCSLDIQDIVSRFGLFGIMNKSINLGDDISGQYIGDDSKFKKVVAGNDVLIEQKGNDAFTYKPTAKHIFSCNNMPRFDDKTGAVKDRLIFIPFPNVYSVENGNLNPHIVKEMTTNENMESLLVLALQSLKELLKNNKFTYSYKSENCLDEFDKDNNPILYFIEEIQENSYLRDKAFNNMPVAEAYDKYINFCQSNGFKSISKISFSKGIRTNIENIEVKAIKNNGKSIKVFKILEQEEREKEY